MSKNSYYAVKQGYHTGIFNNWDRAKREVEGFSKPVFKKFKTKEEAEYFMETGKPMEEMAMLNVIPRGRSRIVSLTRIHKPQPKRQQSKRHSSQQPKRQSSQSRRHSSQSNRIRSASKRRSSLIRTLNKTQSNIIRIKSKDNVSKDNNILKIFTDGSSINNGKKDCKASYAVWFGDDDNRNYAGKITTEPSNQIAELRAIEKALNIVKKTINKDKLETVIIYTDSMYSINCITKWIKIWKKNNFKSSLGKPVKNAVVINSCDQLINSLNKMGIKVVFEHIRSHTTEPKKSTKEWELWYGNKMADKLALNKCKNS